MPCSPAPDNASPYDVLVVGGGINGAGIARELAGRGLSVLLVEQHDLAQHTSSASTKLIHGGLRYLEYYEFGLVRKALAERERLLRSAPHIMGPLSFVMPHDPSMRPAWMIRAGLFLYDHLARREWLPGSRSVALRRHEAGAALQPRFTRGFVYSDGWVDDARLVALCAVDAAARGARVVTHCTCTRAERDAEGWTGRLEPGEGAPFAVRARALVNATGPWAAHFLDTRAHVPHARRLRLVRGSHIVVPRMTAHEFAYLFQNADGRIIFAIPFQQHFTLIGTTDVEHEGSLDEIRASDEEVRYLCEQASRCFVRPVTAADVVWRYAGVRPLLEDEAGNPAAVTRDYRLVLNTEGGAPLLNVWGGKITTFRVLAQEAADLLGGPLGWRTSRWSDDAFLPGGDLRSLLPRTTRPDQDLQAFDTALARAHPELPTAMRRRWVRSYGARVGLLLAAPLGEEVAPGLHEAELHHLHDAEWARSADDVLWRRSKLGLHYTPAQREQVAGWWQRRYGDPATRR